MAGIGADDDPPGLDSTQHLALLNRIVYLLVGTIGGALGSVNAAAASIHNAFRKRALWEHPNNVLSPEAAAVAFVKGAVDEADATYEARLSGIDERRFQAIVTATGNPPGPETLLDLWRRKIIDTARLSKGLRQGILKNEWIDTYEARRYDPLSAGQYLQAAVEGHIALPDAIERAGEVGVAPADAQLIYDTLGNPPGVMEMLRLWKRKVISKEEAIQVIRESHFKNKYTDDILALADYYPPPRTVTTLLSHGAMTEADAQRYFEAYGLSPQLAQAYVASALHSKAASHKELGVSTVRTLFADHMLTRDDALADLSKLGYAGPEANLLLDLSAAQARQKLRTQAIGRVRAIYVGGKLDDSGARADLASIGVDADQMDELLKLWKIEQTTPSKVLTIGQLNQAVKKGLITEAQFKERAMRLGYTADDAELLYQIDIPPEQPA